MAGEKDSHGLANKQGVADMYTEAETEQCVVKDTPRRWTACVLKNWLHFHCRFETSIVSIDRRSQGVQGDHSPQDF